MISIAEAQCLILQQTVALQSEDVELLAGLGRVISEDIYAPWDMPAADNSAMDGYAFSHEALQGNFLKVTGFLPAGTERTVPVNAGEAIKIMTGAPIPPGCDTVVPIENVELVADGIKLKGNVSSGSHIRKKGENTREGDLLITSGTVLGPQELGMIVSIGKNSQSVYRTPTVAVIATGDELVDAGTTPDSATKINSNSYCIAAQVLESGATPVMLGIARDNRDSTREKIMAGLQADLIITSGGVSTGDRDYVKEVIEELGGEILFWKVNMKPGKPFAFALLNGKAIFALPGNPVAAMITFEQFVRPALLKMMGQQRIFRAIVKATVTEPFKNSSDRPQLILSKVTMNNGSYFAETTGDQNSSNLAIMLQANGVVEVAPDEVITTGSEVEVKLLNRLFEMRPPCQ